VPPKSSAEYQVTYHPFTMTKSLKKKKKEGDQEVEVEEMQTHKGSLFFPLPNGTALLYQLQGTSTQPSVENTI
jgi:hydrocephalus-inducing protein